MPESPVSCHIAGVHKVWSVILKPGRPVEKPHGDLTASESMPERNSQDMQSADSSLPKLAGKISSFLVGSLEEKGSKGGVGNRRRGSSGAPGTLQVTSRRAER